MNRRFVVGVITVITVTITLIIISITESQLERQLAYARLPGFSAGIAAAAPIAVSGDDVYIAWPTNQTGNYEVNFRASTDGGATFTDKINLSNSPDADSQDAEIAADGENVIVSWWERNQTSEEPVVRISSDNGSTFEPLLRLTTNGTIG